MVAAAAEVTSDEIIGHLKARLASYKAPRDIESLAELPKTSTGKTLKAQLRAAEWVGATSLIRG